MPALVPAPVALRPGSLRLEDWTPSRRLVQQGYGVCLGSAMKNPWIKKNPFMSMWLSGVHRAIGASRGQIAGSIQREARKSAGANAEALTGQVLEFWGRAIGGPAPRRGRKRR